MENSSYSKTRSPARFLAAFLAFVMVLIVMPVLPVGAASIQEIKFSGVYREEDQGDTKYAYYLSTSNDYLDDLLTESGGEKSWAGISGTVSGDTGTHTVTFTNATTTRNIEFKLVKATNTKLSDLVVYVTCEGAKTVIEPENGTYSFPTSQYANQKIEISIEKKPETHTVSFTGDGMNYHVEISEKETQNAKPLVTGATYEVEDGKEYTLTVSGVPVSQKPVANLSPATNGSLTAFAANEDGSTYTATLSNVTGDIVIKIDRGENNVQLTFEGLTGTGYSVTGVTKEIDATVDISKGGTYTFTVSRDEGYEAPKVEIKKKSGGSWNSFRSSTSGRTTTYTITSITEDLTITITEPGKEKFTVKFPTNRVGYTLKAGEGESVTDVEASASYEHGTPLSIVVEVATGYTGTPEVQIALASGSIILEPSSAEGNKYTFTYTVASEFTVSVRGLSKQTFTWSVTKPDGATVSSYGGTVEYDGKFEIRLTLEPGYEVKNSITLKNGDADLAKDKYTVTPPQGGSQSYTITVQNVTEELHLTIEGITIKTYTVTINSGEGFTTETVTEGEIAHGGTFAFTLSLTDGYRLKNVYYTQDGSELHNNPERSGNQYQIKNVTGNINVTIETELIIYKVVFHTTSTVDYKKLDDGVQVDENYTVTYSAKSAGTSGFFKATAAGCTLDRSKMKPKRSGWKLDGWKNTDNELGLDTITINNLSQADMTIQLDSEWSVDTTRPDGEANNQAFFFVHLTFEQENGKTKYTVSIETNIAESEKKDTAGIVDVLAHGVFYAKTGGDLTTLLEGQDLTSKVQGAAVKNFATMNDGNTVYCYKYDDTDQNREAILKKGSFYLSINDIEGKAGAAWVLVSIDDTPYLFVSNIGTV